MLQFTPQEKVFLLCLCCVVCLGSAIHGLCKVRPDLSQIIELGDSRAFIRRINVNTASADDLARIPYIGEETAEKIVAYRASHGPFHNLNDLYAIPRVSWDLIMKIKLYLRIS